LQNKNSPLKNCFIVIQFFTAQIGGVLFLMKDDAFELLTKMYAEFTARFDKVDARFDEVDERFDKIEGRLGKVERGLEKLGNQVTCLEFDLKKDISALYDGYKQVYEKLNVMDEKLNVLSEKIDNHEIRIQVLESSHRI
jgi:chromosome segregation ATPase